MEIMLIGKKTSLKIKIRKEKRDREYKEIINFYNETFKDERLAYIHQKIILEAAEERGILWKYLRRSVETFVFSFNGKNEFNFEDIFRLAEKYQEEILQEVKYA